MVLRGLLVVCLSYSAAILIDPFEELAEFLTGIVFPSFRKEEGGALVPHVAMRGIRTR